MVWAVIYLNRLASVNHPPAHLTPHPTDLSSAAVEAHLPRTVTYTAMHYPRVPSIEGDVSAQILIPLSGVV